MPARSSSTSRFAGLSSRTGNSGRSRTRLATIQAAVSIPAGDQRGRRARTAPSTAAPSRTLGTTASALGRGCRNNRIVALHAVRPRRRRRQDRRDDDPRQRARSRRAATTSPTAAIHRRREGVPAGASASGSASATTTGSRTTTSTTSTTPASPSAGRGATARRWPATT